MVPYILVIYLFDWQSNKMYVDLYVFFIPLYFALHVSGAICTHPVATTTLKPINMPCKTFPHQSELDRAKSVRVSQPVPATMD
jgi:hypothetical protein